MKKVSGLIKTFFALILVFVISGCSGFTEYRFWHVYSMTEPARSSSKTFEDKNISVRFWLDEKKVHFQLKNRSDGPISINWAKASFINADGSAHPLANSSSVFTDKRNNPEPSELKPGEKIVDFIVPVDNVEKLEEWTWYVYPMFNQKDDRAYENRGKTIGVDLPIQANNRWKTYAFRFQVTNVIPSLQHVN